MPGGQITTGERPAARRAHTAWAVFWRIIVFLLAWGMLAAPFFVLARTQIEEWSRTNPVFMRLCADGWAVLSLLLATWLMARFVERVHFRVTGVTLTNLPRDFVAGLGIGVAWLALSLAFAWVAGWFAPVDHRAFPWEALPLAALATIANVVAQQLLLCGYLFAMLRARAGLVAAVIVSGILFCAYHAPAFQGHWLPALNVVFTATLFCLAREVSGGIWMPAGIHFAWNFLLGPALGLTVSGTEKLGEGWRAFQVDGPAWATGGEFGIEGSVTVTVATLLLLFVVISVITRRRAQAGGAPSGQT